jgi:hypothetical protein
MEFRSGDRVCVITGGGTEFRGQVEELLEYEDGELRLRVVIPEYGTCRYIYDVEANLWADADDDELKVTVRLEAEAG